MAAAVLGIYGNSKQEAMYPMYGVDSDGQKLTGTNKYTLHFANGQLPPVNAFGSADVCTKCRKAFLLQIRLIGTSSIQRCCRNLRKMLTAG